MRRTKTTSCAGPEYRSRIATWEAFKDSVKALFPDAGKPKDFTLQELEATIAEWKTKGIKTVDDVDGYTRSFTTINNSLKAQNISHLQQKLYCQAFGEPERTLLERRAEVLYTNRAWHQLTLAELKDIARYNARHFGP